MTEQDLLFSMDIGTRTVVGIVGYHDGEKFNIIEHEIQEHKERAMYDGQVHDIELVAKAAQKVKEKIEAKINVSLKKVSIAAAGRSLKTCKTFVERDIETTQEIDREIISSVEIEAIQKAQLEIEKSKNEDEVAYYCVGYAIVNYYLNGNIIANLEGHKGRKVGIEVLSTFLPKIVVDSLYAVMSRVGLEVSSLTLEPIAAMNVSIHSNLRLLNIALVDIGAGTSDIALTKSGTVFAFAMAPVAGDEITEKLAENYLLDFDTAEKVKISLAKKSKIKFKDVMGLSHEKSRQEIIDIITPSIKALASEIANKIVEFNGKSPSAVFLIGGGSQIPMLVDYIAEYLQIPVERVGVRKANIIRDVQLKTKKMTGPEFITPIGIAVTAHMNRQKDFFHVTVNNKSVKLFNSKKLNVADALILVGYNPRNLIGRRGDSISFSINGKKQIQKGQPGEAAIISINGEQSGLNKEINNGDRIDIEPAIDGDTPKIYIKDYMEDINEKRIIIDGKTHTLKPHITKNGNSSNQDEQISNEDNIIIKEISTLKELVEYFDLTYSNMKYTINGKEAMLNDSVCNGDIVSFESDDVTDVFEENMTSSQKTNSHLGIEVLVNNEVVRLYEQDKSEYMFLDILNHIDINLEEIKGIGKMLVNGINANFTDIIKDGDNIHINWD